MIVWRVSHGSRKCSNQMVFTMNVSIQSPIALNDAQQSVLIWIRDGCPDGVYDPKDSSHKVSARALHNRGLIRVSGRGPRWKVVLTERGEVWPEAVAEDIERFERERERARLKLEEGKAVAKMSREHQQAEAVNESSALPSSSEADSPVVSRRHRRTERQPREPELEVVSPAEARRRGHKPKGDKLTGGAIDPWDEKIMITVKEAAWMLSLPERAIREAVANGDVLRVFIGNGKKNYRVIYGSLLAWVNSMPREPRVHRLWW